MRNHDHASEATVWATQEFGEPHHAEPRAPWSYMVTPKWAVPTLMVVKFKHKEDQFCGSSCGADAHAVITQGHHGSQNYAVHTNALAQIIHYGPADQFMAGVTLSRLICSFNALCLL